MKKKNSSLIRGEFFDFRLFHLFEKEETSLKYIRYSFFFVRFGTPFFFSSSRGRYTTRSSRHTQKKYRIMKNSTGGDSSNCQSSSSSGDSNQTQQQQRRGPMHEVFGDTNLGMVMLVLLLMHLMQYAMREPCTC